MKLCTACGSAADGTSRFCSTCGAEFPTEEDSDPLVGKVIGGSFVVRELIGVGGMGRVYRGEQNTLGRTVAIKVIHPHLHSDEQTVQRFYAEARAASRLNHPNSVSVIDFGRSDDGVLYLVMEYLDGRDLSALMVEQGPLAVSRVVDLVAQTLDALAEAHDLGIVHRDLKPENVFVLKSRLGQERVKVLDFGLATVVDSSHSITRPGLICGTPSYMSPEQARGEPVDARSDLYSMGAVLFELLTDRPPFEGETPVRILMKHVHDAPPDPRVVAPTRDISNELAGVVVRALAKNLDERFQSALDFKRALLATKAPVSTSIRVERPRLCLSCGASNDSSMRYCGSCGARLPGFSTGPGRRSQRLTPSGVSFPFVGRVDEVSAIVASRDASLTRAQLVRVVGEAGMGRTRLCDEVCARFSVEGDVVANARPHPSGVPVAYSMASALVRDLLGLGEDAPLTVGLPANLGPIVRAGLEELESPTGLRGLENVSRAPAVGSAVAWAVRQALTRAHDHAVVACIDDFDVCDNPSRVAIRNAAVELRDDPVLWLVVGARFDPGLPVREVHVHPLGEEDAHTMIAEMSGTTVDPTFRASPRALAQLSILGERLADASRRTLLTGADLAVARLDRLDSPSRRMLQALAVLGRSAPIDLVAKVSGISDSAPIGDLRGKHLIVLSDSKIEFTEPFFAPLVASMIPAEAKRLLHAAALDACEDMAMPTEVLAEHAAMASEGMRSLVILERAGDVSMRRGDIDGAVRIFRRGVDLARRESIMSGEQVFDGARVSFGRKLGEAMTALGEYVSADGLLREILDVPELDRSARARVQLAVARVSRLRGRSDDATRQLVSALELASGKFPELEAAIQTEIGELRASTAQWSQAVSAWRRAGEILAARDADHAALARIASRLVDAALAVADVSAYESAIGVVEREATRAEAPAIAARAYARAARSNVPGLDLERARETAMALAAASGDAETFRQLVVID